VFPQTTSSDYVDELLSEEAIKRAGCFNPAKVAGLAKKIRSAEATSAGETQDMAFLGILSTQLIHDQYLENFAGHSVEPTVPNKIIRKS
jgi:asparagine synthase (glutamine-hydrolysing)